MNKIYERNPLLGALGNRRIKRGDNSIGQMIMYAGDRFGYTDMKALVDLNDVDLNILVDKWEQYYADRGEVGDDNICFNAFHEAFQWVVGRKLEGAPSERERISQSVLEVLLSGVPEKEPESAGKESDEWKNYEKIETTTNRYTRPVTSEFCLYENVQRLLYGHLDNEYSGHDPEGEGSPRPLKEYISNLAQTDIDGLVKFLEAVRDRIFDSDDLKDLLDRELCEALRQEWEQIKGKGVSGMDQKQIDDLIGGLRMLGNDIKASWERAEDPDRNVSAMYFEKLEALICEITSPTDDILPMLYVRDELEQEKHDSEDGGAVSPSRAFVLIVEHAMSHFEGKSDV